MIRICDGRNETPSLGIVDSKSIRNSHNARDKGYDSGKKISGIKVHITVDTSGLPAAVHVTTADVTDRNGAIDMASSDIDAFATIAKCLFDGGYTGEKFANAFQTITGAEVEVIKRNEMHTFKVVPKRWIVERTFSWLDKCRRLWRNCERSLYNTCQMVKLAFIAVLLGRF